MPSLRDLRRRIKSVKNTQQITRAMKMVAAAKLRRAQENVQAARPYAEKVFESVRNLAGSEAAQKHPLFNARPQERIDLVLMTSDRGLCGGFNANLIKRGLIFLLEEKPNVKVTLHSVGRKGGEFFRKRGYNVGSSRDGFMNKFTYNDSVDLAKAMVQRYLDGECDAVYVLYMEFKSVMTQIPKVAQLIPFVAEGTGGPAADYLYEPDVASLLDGLLPRAINSRFYRYLLETSASEHGARMTAMDSATNNAKDVIRKLTLGMNRQRQAAITKEIIEIVSGAQAL